MATPSSVTSATIPADGTPVPSAALRWVEYLKALALIWIFLTHVGEALFGFPYFGNPSPNWPPLAERVAQVAPLSGHGLLDLPLNLLRYLGWTGDQGVSVFLILSGFGLTWGLLARGRTGSLALVPFYLRRFGRVFPLWWGANALALGIALLSPAFFNISIPGFLLNLLGIRVTPDTLYALVPAWWYVTLLLQLYLIFPLLWAGLRRVGPGRLLLAMLVIALPVRLLGLLIFTDYLDAWSRGAIFIARLPEFALGISLAAWLHANPRAVDGMLRSGRSLLLAAGVFVLGLVASFTLAGMTVAPLLMGGGAFVLLYGLVRGGDAPESRGGWSGLYWLGVHSYSLYLMHHLVILFAVPAGTDPFTAQAWLRVTAAAGGSVIAALFLEGAVGGAQRLGGRWRSRFGWRGITLRVALMGAVAYGALIGLELAVRQWAPQEVFGWGERPALTPSEAFGWTLRPDSTTRLRWESYDYLVEANALGFPGPEYSDTRAPGALRVLVTGDAFTSGEGVDTAQAWPRLMEAQLSDLLGGRSVEVLNFGMTGYGPDQMARVVEAYAPRFEPDLILVEFFINEFEDVRVTDDEFRHAIGFGLTPQDSLSTILTLAQLRQFVTTELIQPLSSLWSGRPSPQAYFYAGLPWLERANAPANEVQAAVGARLERLRAVADEVGAQIALVLVPSAAQVCTAENDPGFPRGVDLSDAARYDPEGPQRALTALADQAGIVTIDLRAALTPPPGDPCLYQPYNLHWLPAGHVHVARTVAGRLLEDELLPAVAGEGSS